MTRPWSSYCFVPVAGFRVRGLRRPMVEACDTDRAVAARLASQFSDVWHDVDRGSRRAVSKLWREAGVRPPGLYLGVAPVLHEITVMGDERSDLPVLRAIGACSGDGKHLRFASPFVERSPDEAVQALVAHELAHSVLRSLPGDYGGDLDAEHLDVEHLMGVWGYTERSIDDSLALLRGSGAWIR